MFNFTDLLSITVRSAWIIFGLYVLLVFLNTTMRHGVVIALIRLISVRIVVPLLIPIAFTLIARALVFVPPQEVGVVVSILSPGGIRPQPLRAGLHWIIPALEWEKTYPIYWQTYTMAGFSDENTVERSDSIRARTSDGQEVHLDTSIIFRIDEQQVVALHVEWQERYIVDLVRPVIRGIVRQQVSQFTVSEVNSSSRKDLEVALDRILREEFSGKGLIVDQFLLRDISFTPEFALSIEHKQIALEKREMAIYEADRMRNLAEGEADALRLRADGEADALAAIANSLGGEEQLVTYRYVEQLAPNIRVMLVPSQNPFILPLPDLEESLMPTVTVPITQVNPPDSEQSAPAPPSSDASGEEKP